MEKKDEKFTTSLTTSRTTLDVCHNTDRGRCPNQMKSDEKWKRGNVEKWKRGKVETWKRGNVETWKRGNVETWKRGNEETWKSGNVETWKRGNVETWKRGNVKTWKRGKVIPSSTRYLEWVVPGVPRGGLTSPPDIRPFGGYDFRPLGPLSYVEWWWWWWSY